MVKIQINGTVYEVSPGKNLLHTCLALGFNIPYFCYHPALGSVGACRQCAVKKHANAGDKKGRIIMSCMEPVVDGLIISTEDPEIKGFRMAVIEYLMTNHPHDCPICDEGGECHLQDMTVMTGHTYRRFTFKKRTHKNQNLGPFIHHEMNRCIQCYRCVRFYRDYAGGNDLIVSGSANRVYFGRFRDGVLESEFSGNLVEVCPTGVFTDKTLKEHYTRKWDLTNSPSVCVHCSLGCNTIISERYGAARRILSRYNKDVNGYFLCDRGRFGYEFLNNPDRIKEVILRTGPKKNNGVVSDEAIHSAIRSALKRNKIAGIGSPRASLESNYALETLVGKDNFIHGISDIEYQLTRTAIQILKRSIAHSPSLNEIQLSDALFIMGEDISCSAPMMALAVRQASRNKSFEIAEKLGIQSWNDAPVRELAQQIRTPIFIASHCKTKLDEVSEEKYFASPDDIARLGFTVASMIDKNAPSPENFDNSLEKIAQKIAEALLSAYNPLIITGLQYKSKTILQASANIAIALSNKGKKPSLSIVFPECNSLGLGLMDGRHPGDLLNMIKKGETDTLIILENDLYIRDEEEKANEILDKCKYVIAIDHLKNETTGKVDILLPAAPFSESTGTIVNNEGRAQRYYSVIPSDGPVKESWKYLSEMIKIAGKEKNRWEKFDDIVNSLVASYPVFSGIKEKIPDSQFRYYDEKIARQTARSSGRTAINTNTSVNEPGPPQDFDSPLAFSMEGYKGVSSSYLTPFYWSPGLNSVHAMNKYMDEPGGDLKNGNPGVPLFIGKSNSNLLEKYFEDIPEAFMPLRGKMLVLPVDCVFGSEELSCKSKSISELIPDPFLIMNKSDIRKWKMVKNETVKLFINKIALEVKLKEDDNIPDGVAGLSKIIPGMPYLDLPDYGIIEKHFKD